MEGNPGFFVMDPLTGKITAEFRGHVSAEGLDLLAGTAASPPIDRRIRWLKESNGALVAQLSAFESGVGDQVLELEVMAPNGIDDCAFVLDARNTGDPTASQISLNAGTAGRILLTSDSRSHWLQLKRGPTPVNLQLQQGIGVVNMPVGVAGVNVPLDAAWPNNHLLFMCSINPGVHFNYTVPLAGAPNGLANGQFVSNNAGALQGVFAQWISIGN